MTGRQKGGDRRRERRWEAESRRKETRRKSEGNDEAVHDGLRRMKEKGRV